MRVALIRWIDKYIGNAFIFILSLLSPRRLSASPAVNNIVVSKYFGLGSILMATPMLRTLRSECPNARITIVTLKQNEALARSLPFVDDVVLIDDSSLLSVVTTTISAVEALRRNKIDAFFDLEFFSRYSAIVAFLSRAVMRVGYSTQGNPRSNLLTHSIETMYPAHMPRVFLSQLGAAGITSTSPDDQTEVKLFDLRDAMPQESFSTADTKLRERGITDYVLFNATGGEAIGREREWPASCWAQLADLIGEELGLHVVFTGVKEKASEIEEIMSRCRGIRIHNMAGATSFYEFLASIANARAVVTIDSAALHIAQSVETPTVSLHGPELPLAHAYPEDRNRALHKGVNGNACPCFDFFKNRKVSCQFKNQCMRDITPEEVLEAVKEVARPTEGAYAPSI